MKFNFLICSERSGSNLITKIFDAHPKICGPFPSHLMEWFSLNLYRYGNISKDYNWNILLKDLVEFMDKGFFKWRSNFNVEMVEKGVKKRSFKDIYKYIYETEAKANNKNILFVKNNCAYSYLAYITSCFKNAKYVYLVRDPRDMALVWKENAAAPGGIKEGAKKWKKDQSESIKAYGYLKDLDKIILIKFEDLLKNTEKEIRKICEFLEVDFTNKMFEFYKSDLVKENCQNRPGWQDLPKPIMHDNYNNYKTKLSDIEVKYIEAFCEEEMKFFNYEKEFDSEENDIKKLEKKLKSLPKDEPRFQLEEEKNARKKFWLAKKRILSRELYRD